MWLFLPCYHLTAWCFIFYLDIILLPWSNISTLISFYCRDVKFSILISFYWRDVIFFTLILFYCRDVTFSTLLSFNCVMFYFQPWCLFSSVTEHFSAVMIWHSFFHLRHNLLLSTNHCSTIMPLIKQLVQCSPHFTSCVSSDVPQDMSRIADSPPFLEAVRCSLKVLHN